MEIPPRVGWISHHLPQNGWIKIQPSLTWAKARRKNLKNFYDPTTQSSQMGVYLGFSNLLNNSNCESESLLPFSQILILKVKEYCHSHQFQDLFCLKWETCLSSIVPQLAWTNPTQLSGLSGKFLDSWESYRRVPHLQTRCQTNSMQVAAVLWVWVSIHDGEIKLHPFVFMKVQTQDKILNSCWESS